MNKKGRFREEEEGERDDEPGGATGETLDICPAIVKLPNPLSDPGDARAAEITVGGSDMPESISSKEGKEISSAVMKRQVISVTGVIRLYDTMMHFTQHSA